MFDWSSLINNIFEMLKNKIPFAVRMAIFLTFIASYYFLQIAPDILCSIVSECENKKSDVVFIGFVFCVLYLPIYLLVIGYTKIEKKIKFEIRMNKKIQSLSPNQRLLIAAIYLKDGEAELDTQHNATVENLVNMKMLSIPSKAYDNYNQHSRLESWVRKKIKNFKKEIERLENNKDEISKILNKYQA